MRNEGVLKNWYGLCENAWFPWQPIADLRRGAGGMPTKVLISQLLLYLSRDMVGWLVGWL